MVTDAVAKIEVLFMRGERVTLAFAEGRDIDAAFVALRASLTDTRPTADLGDDGELVEQLRKVEGAPLCDWARKAITEAADRLILYREALAWIEAFAQVRSKDDAKTFARVNRGALRTIAERCGAVLSRSGG